MSLGHGHDLLVVGHGFVKPGVSDSGADIRICWLDFKSRALKHRHLTVNQDYYPRKHTKNSTDADGFVKEKINLLLTACLEPCQAL